MTNHVGKPRDEGAFRNLTQITEIEMTVGIDQSRADKLILMTGRHRVRRMADRLRSPHGNDLLALEEDRPRRMQGERIRDDGGLNEALLIQILARPLWMK